jgi:hypothetical protein
MSAHPLRNLDSEGNHEGKIGARVITFPDISTCHRAVMSNTASLLEKQSHDTGGHRKKPTPYR